MSKLMLDCMHDARRAAVMLRYAPHIKHACDNKGNGMQSHVDLGCVFQHDLIICNYKNRLMIRCSRHQPSLGSWE
jgi:hypothetical protein